MKAGKQNKFNDKLHFLVLVLLRMHIHSKLPNDGAGNDAQADLHSVANAGMQ